MKIEDFKLDKQAFAFKRDHMCGYLKTPDRMKELPRLEAISSLGGAFQCPRTVDLRDYCTKTEDQGSRPWCAAYTACQWAENIRWRVNDVVENINPEPIYKYAKSIDGSPSGDGTTLNAALEGLLEKGYFKRGLSKVRNIWGGSHNIKYAVHKFGCALCGFNITDEWYAQRNGKSTITGINARTCGGHAVLACGFNDDGLIIQNSWGTEWGQFGFALVTWDAFAKQFVYGAVLSNVLDGMTCNT